MAFTRHIFFVGTALTFASASMASESWHVSERSGAVTVLHSGVIKAALSGAEVVAGDLVTTGSNGRAVLVRGEDYLVVAPSSKLHVAQPVAANPLLQMFQDSGNVVYKIKHLATPHFSVQTPYLAAVVKGTTFSITVTDAGTALQVIQGALEVQTNDGAAKELVTTGMVALVKASDIFRLSVGGASPHTVTSPNTHIKPIGAAPERPLQPAAIDPKVPVIAARISEPAISLTTLTAGLVDGSASFASDTSNTTKTAALVKTAMADATAAVAATKAEPVTPAPAPAASTTVASVATAIAPTPAPVVTTPPAIAAQTPTPAPAAVVEPVAAAVVTPTSAPPGTALPPVAVAIVTPPPAPVAASIPAPAAATVTTPKPLVTTPPVIIAQPASSSNGNQGGNSGSNNSSPTALKTNSGTGNSNAANTPGQAAFAAALAALLAKAATLLAALPPTH